MPYLSTSPRLDVPCSALRTSFCPVHLDSATTHFCYFDKTPQVSRISTLVLCIFAVIILPWRNTCSLFHTSTQGVVLLITKFQVGYIHSSDCVTVMARKVQDQKFCQHQGTQRRTRYTIASGIQELGAL